MENEAKHLWELLESMQLDMSRAGDAAVGHQLRELIEFVEGNPTRLLVMKRHIAEMDARVEQICRPDHLQKAGVTKYGILQELQELKVMRRNLTANCELNEAKVDLGFLQERMEQMIDMYHLIPLSERNEQSWLDVCHSMFDLSATHVKYLAKDHCARCHQPLICLKKQALLLCTRCATMTRNLAPLNESNASSAMWIKTPTPIATTTNAATTQESKRIQVIQQKLQQFSETAPKIDSLVVFRVKEALRETNHFSGTFVAAPTPVGNALKKLGLETLVAYREKIANLINGIPICALKPAQIDEIISRLRAVHRTFQELRGKHDRTHTYNNFFVHQICLLMGERHIADCFPPQRTVNIFNDHMSVWTAILQRLRNTDRDHSWIQNPSAPSTSVTSTSAASTSATCTSAASTSATSTSAASTSATSTSAASTSATSTSAPTTFANVSNTSAATNAMAPANPITTNAMASATTHVKSKELPHVQSKTFVDTNKPMEF